MNNEYLTPKIPTTIHLLSCTDLIANSRVAQTVIERRDFIQGQLGRIARHLCVDLKSLGEPSPERESSVVGHNEMGLFTVYRGLLGGKELRAGVEAA